MTTEHPDTSTSEQRQDLSREHLSLDERAALTAGRDVWTVPGIATLGLPPLKMTDGPNGARGAEFVSGVRSVAVPCGAALAATFDPELLERVGALLGREARQKRCRVLLAPTINLVRSPLYGRSFECYGEDPWLSGRLAAAFVSGVQSEGVATTAKHLVGNEAEYQRYTIDSRIDERTLREVYLQPFEWAVRHGNTLGIMTSYNRLNGTYCTEDTELLTGIVRDEWGFEGFFVSDWFGAGDTIASLQAGLDVQMPGPDRFFGAPVSTAVANGDVDESLLDAVIDRRVHLHERLGAWDDDSQEPELGVEHDEDRALAHEAAVAAMTLLRNDGVLPLDPELASVALIGPNAEKAHIMGGGSAQLAAHRRPSMVDVLGERLGDRLRFEPGCVIDKDAPLLRPDDGFAVEFFLAPDWSGEVVATAERKNGRAIWSGEPAAVIGTAAFSARMGGRVTIQESGTHTFTLVQTDPSRVLIDGEVVLDGVTARPERGSALFGMGSVEMTVDVELTAGQVIDVVVELSGGEGTGIRGAVVGHRKPVPADLIERAAAAAAACDVAIVVVGTSSEWETEGVDRESIDLPGDQDALVAAVCAANPRTVVVVNTGSPVTMGWVDKPAAILAAWLGGQEMSPALADVLFGVADPGGRLPVTFPERIEHTPSYGNFPGESNRTTYTEGLLVGHRWYDARHLGVLFPFGAGQSYSSFAWTDAQVLRQGQAAATVQVQVTNTGVRAGSDVVQLYVEPTPSALAQPVRRLAGVAKVNLAAGASTTVQIDVTPRAFAHWNPANTEHLDLMAAKDGAAAMPRGGDEPTVTERGWYVDAGTATLCIARSSADIVERIPFEIEAMLGPLVGEDSLP